MLNFFKKNLFIILYILFFSTFPIFSKTQEKFINIGPSLKCFEYKKAVYENLKDSALSLKNADSKSSSKDTKYSPLSLKNTDPKSSSKDAKDSPLSLKNTDPKSSSKDAKDSPSLKNADSKSSSKDTKYSPLSLKNTDPKSSSKDAFKDFFFFKDSKKDFFLDLSFNIPFKNPILDFQTSSSWSYSLSISIAYGLKSISDLKDHIAIRFFEFYIYAYLNDLINTLAKESAHYRHYRNMEGYYLFYPIPTVPYLNIPIFGNFFTIKKIKQISPLKLRTIFFLDEESDFDFDSYYIYPEKSNAIISKEKNLDYNIHLELSGLYQNLDIAYISYEKSILKKSMNWADAYIFSSNLFYPSFLILSSFIRKDPWQNFWFDNYISLMEEKNLFLNKKEIVSYSLLSVLLNWQFIQSFILISYWILENKREIPIPSFKGIISTPLVRYYMNRFGDFLDIVIPFLKPIPIFINLGFGASTTFLFRIGAKFFIDFNDYFSTYPSLSISYNHMDKKVGFEIATQVNFNLVNLINYKIDLFTYFSYSERNFMKESLLKNNFLKYWNISSYPNFIFSLGITYQFAY